MKNLFVLCIPFILIGCSPNPGKKQSPGKREVKSWQMLLEEASLFDTFEHYEIFPLIYIRTGYFFTGEKNAIVIFGRDSSCSVKIFKANKTVWELTDSFSIKYLSPIQCRTTITDYNFDGLNDLFIQTSGSNGFSLTRGLLLTYNPKTHKLKSHMQTLHMPNIKPDHALKTLVSETDTWDSAGHRKHCTCENKWNKDSLIVSKKNCKAW